MTIDIAAVTAAGQHRRDHGRYDPNVSALSLLSQTTPADMEPYRARLIEYLGVIDTTARATVDSLMANPSGYDITIPAFFAWLADQPTPAAPTVTTYVPYTADEMDSFTRFSARGTYEHGRFAVWAPTVRRWAATLTPTESFLVHGHHESEPERFDTLGDFLRQGPTAYPGTAPLFAAWLRRNNQTVPDTDPTTVTVTPAYTLGSITITPTFGALPTSPRAAFPTVEDAVDACRRWERDTDPRLPDQRSNHDSIFTRSGYRWHHADHTYSIEVRRGWEADDFTVGSDYARGFWRDVRTLGYGTPAWEVSPTTTVPSGDTDPTETRMTFPITDYTSVDAFRAMLVATPTLLREHRALLDPWRANTGYNEEFTDFLCGIGENRFGFTLGGTSHATALESVLTYIQSHLTLFTAAATPAATTPTMTFPFDITAEELAARRVEILRPFAAQFHQWNSSGPGYGSTVADVNEWEVYMTTGEGRGETVRMWNETDWGTANGGRYLRPFLTWAREHRDLFTTTTTETTTTDTVIPIGPEHPGWQAFAEQLAEIATRNNMCPEYDRIARAVGLPTRKQRVSYRVVLEVEIDVERDHNADVRQLRDAASAALETVTARGARSFEQSRSQIVA